MESLLDRLETTRVPLPSRGTLIALAACLLVGVVAGGRIAAPPAPGRAELPTVEHVSPADGGPGTAALVVDVSGAVRRPGVYPLREGARVLDAIRAAGGPSDNADLAPVNRAAPLVDGQQVLVPERTATAAAVADPAAAATGGDAPAGPVVSLNSADVAALDALPGIGPVTAQKIVDDRTRNGPFRSVEELDRVPGIGPGIVARLEGLVGP